MLKITGIFVITKTNCNIHGNFENRMSFCQILAKYIHSKNAFKTVLARSEAEKNSFLVLTDVVYMAVITSFNRYRRFSKLTIIWAGIFEISGYF